ncbi:MAG: hypothetical protein JW747_03960 [Candidatus Aminicenantes bacterium]|nr:hypothetical protein [Candidatus Aminicenantes bacterium]
MKNGAVALLFVLGIVLAPPPPAQAVERIVLNYEGSLGGLQLGPYGQASVIIRVKGEAWLLAEGRNRWQGIGKMTVRTDVQASPSRGVKISPAEAPEASFKVTAAVKAGKLEFWFESKPIELKGTISFQAPAPVGTITEPYTLDFNSATVAPGPPAVTAIEMKDGAVKTVDYSKFPTVSPIVSGAMVFTLNEVEEWRVLVTGREIDMLQPPITNKALKPPNTELPVMAGFEWNLAGVFYIVGAKSSPSYYEGSVFSASYQATIYFDFQDLYRCFFLPGGKHAEEMSATNERRLTELDGRSITGQVKSGGVKLSWPEYFPEESVRCKPIKTFLGKAFYTRTFGTKEFLYKISGETLPLKDGAVVSGGVKDWMSYKIVLHKIK